MRKMMVIFFFLFLCQTLFASDDYGPATWDPAYSGNYTVGRGGNSIQYVIIHVIQGSYSGCISWFKNPNAQVSAHYVVSKGGSITQMVRESNTGWHAGNWSYNQKSIGIEHEGYVSDPGFPDAMYRSAGALVKNICNKYGIPKDRSHIIGHIEVPGATHTDPGPNWDWDIFMSYVKSRDIETPVAAVREEQPVEEYRLKPTSVQFNVEKVQKSMTLQTGEVYQETMIASNIYENNTSAQTMDIIQNNEFLKSWKDMLTVSYTSEEETVAELIYIYDRYDYEVWFKSGQEWQKLGTLTAYMFKGYKIESRK